jgi:Phosphotransferase system, mannose/fructose/N-acetylgalactosamine-specific component IID
MIKLDKNDLKKGWLSWQFWAMSTLSFEKLEANGFAQSMIPIANKLYKKGSPEYNACLKRHSVFYNTEPQTGSIVNGIIASLEEERANGGNVSDDMFHSIKTGLMGPIAGIGDSMVQGILIPILLSIGMGISASGNPVGVLFYLITYMAIMFCVDYFLYLKGYKLGLSAVDILVGDNSDRLRSAFNILGTMVVGGLGANFVKLSTKIQIVNSASESVFDIQKTLDGFFPGLLGLLAVLISWHLISNKRWSSNKVLLFLVGVATIGVLLGIF